MYNLEKVVYEHGEKLELILDFNDFTGKTVNTWMIPFIESMTDEGALPYLLGNEHKNRYRASPLASSLIWMCSVGVLPENVIDNLQDKLLFLRDHREPTDNDKGNEKKIPEDNDGWSLAEGVSVWSTSMALIALLDNNRVGIAKIALYKNSILWLVKQQKDNGNGWGYQASHNCNENIIMTALAMRALSLALLKTDKAFSDSEKKDIKLSLNNGFKYIKDNIKYSKGKVKAYWCFGNTPHCAATVWALRALKEYKTLNFNPEAECFFVENLERCKEFILAKMPDKCAKWEDEQIVNEAGAKYNKQKNYYSFSATLLLDMFELGLSPLHPKVILQMKWLIQNEENWKITKYDNSQVCTFTYAMIFSTIAKWRILVGKEYAGSLMKSKSNKWSMLMQKITGMPIIEKSYTQIVIIPRIVFVWFLTILMVIVFSYREIYVAWILGNAQKIFNWGIGIQDELIVNIVASILYAVLCGVLTLLWKMASSVLKWLGGKL